VIRPLTEIAPSDLPLVGGKGLNLGRLYRANLPVPPGFVITTEAYRRRNDSAVESAIVAAYRQLGGVVAVRSSATAEDLQSASFAGQQETILGVEGDTAVLAAVRTCWASLFTERAVAYRRANGIPDETLSMAVIVQRLVDAEVAGVLFTRDPADPTAEHLLIEASWGLGEAVVSGRVTPDRWTVERHSGRVLKSEIARKAVMVVRGAEVEVPAERQAQPSLTSADLEALAELGRGVETEYGTPQDIEWAMVGGVPFLLQSRPITVAGNERERVRLEEIAFLRVRAEPGGTVWARYSLAEVLPEPLTMSWCLWKSFMSGGGGYGRMYRELGYDPDPCLETDGILDLIAGRPYFNLSRDVRLYFRHFPYDYPFARLKANPELAIYPTPEANLARAQRGFLLKSVSVVRQMLAAQKQLERAAEELPERLEAEAFPRIERHAAELRGRDLTPMSDAELLGAFEETRRIVFDEFASQGLKASVLSGLAVQALQAALTPSLGADAARAQVDAVLAGATPPPGCDLAAAMRSLDTGTLSQADFIAGFGHRGPGEMELANPRWREMGVVGLGLDHKTGVSSGAANPNAIRSSGRKVALQIERARRFTGLREAAKHYLMLGYEGLRLILLELDRRYSLHGGIFYLEPSELEALVRGEDLRPWIVERRRRRALALGIEAPRVLFSDDLEALGRPIVPVGAGEAIAGSGVSSGVAEGSALVLRSPHAAPPDARDFILVCPSTDPGWVPLFLRARGVVMETGGVLSHGAIVAREFGLPAVANISDACTRFTTGQRLKVDGTTGKVWLL